VTVPATHVLATCCAGTVTNVYRHREVVHGTPSSALLRHYLVRPSPTAYVPTIFGKGRASSLRSMTRARCSTYHTPGASRCKDESEMYGRFSRHEEMRHAAQRAPGDEGICIRCPFQGHRRSHPFRRQRCDQRCVLAVIARCRPDCPLSTRGLTGAWRHVRLHPALVHERICLSQRSDRPPRRPCRYVPFRGDQRLFSPSTRRAAGRGTAGSGSPPLSPLPTARSTRRGSRPDQQRIMPQGDHVQRAG